MELTVRNYARPLLTSSFNVRCHFYPAPGIKFILIGLCLKPVNQLLRVSTLYNKIDFGGVFTDTLSTMNTFNIVWLYITEVGYVTLENVFVMSCQVCLLLRSHADFISCSDL